MGFMLLPGQSRSLCQEWAQAGAGLGSQWGHKTHKGWCRRVCSLPQYF